MAIVSLHLGQAGVQLGDLCWFQYATEHGLDSSGNFLEKGRSDSNATLRSNLSNESMNKFQDMGDSQDTGPRVSDGFHWFFQELSDGRYAPRAIFADMEPSVIDMVKSGPLSRFYSPHLMIAGKEDAANNYARGCYAMNKSIDTLLLDQLRKVAEVCDRLQGFMVFHSVGGGTGSGYHACLLNQLHDEYSKATVLGLAIFPSPRLSTAVVEPYNAVLNTNATLDNTDCVFQTDNEAMYNICINRLGIENPTYTSLNRLLAATVSSITASLRFKGSLNADFVDFQTNLVPYPRIHFSVMSYAPIVSAKKIAHESLSITDLTLQVFNTQHRLSTCDNETGRYIACCLLYRGDVTPKDVNTAIAQIKTKKSVQFVPWSPTGIKVGINHKIADSLPDGDMAAPRKTVCMVCNTTAVQKSWESLNKKYDVMLRKKAFVHWYTGEGMDEREFLEAQANVLTLENDYNELN